VGPRAGLEAVEQRNTLAPTGNRAPAVQLVAVPTELSRLLETLYTRNYYKVLRRIFGLNRSERVNQYTVHEVYILSRSANTLRQ
jgi:hypothetical protein